MRTVLIVIACTILSIAGTLLFIGKDSSSTAQETTFDRVVRTGTLRCGYATWYPNLIVDPNTHEYSGVSYDVMNEIGRRLGLKIEWAQEAGFGSAEQDLIAGKYDMLCADVCFEARRNKFASFSRPFNQNPLYLITRGDDQRFNAGYESANRSDVVAATLSNSIFDAYIRDHLPLAKSIDVSELGADADVMATLSSKKADVSFNNLISVDLYNKAHTDKMKAIKPAIGTCNGSFMLPLGDDQLKSLIDGALNEILADDMMPAIYKKYLPDSSDYWRVPEQTTLRGKE